YITYTTGRFNLTLERISGTWLITGSVANDTWIIDHFLISGSFKNLIIYVDNLFEGNREINDVINTFVNEYWPPLARVAMPVAVKKWDTYLTDLLNRLFSKLSFSKIFP
ncbi:PREDICTED: uncharacterized protein LOC106751432, partial [Dinoponera quadriceps]|uniref:Uncharacterized protein LOC106751432 n=1 Tax=Dinoponera quadriceps TaxID=609295 RepID=A0A6P3YCY8_DINQU